MKRWWMFIVITLIALNTQSQCNIWCKDDNKKKPRNIAFRLVLEPLNGKKPIISSDKNGFIWISKRSYDALKYKHITAFQFIDPMMHQYYAAPYFLKSRKVMLSSLCGTTLIVTTNW